MQYKFWFDEYQKNKDKIKDPYKFFLQWSEFHKDLINDQDKVEEDSKWEKLKKEIARAFLKKDR